MPNITNHKITDLAPTWADFRGFTFLFDNPNSAANLLDINHNLHKVNCSKSDTSIAFYRVLNERLVDIGLGSSTNPYSFCPLPFHSYHVTYLDGINDKNKANLNPADRVAFNTFLKNLPDSLKSDTKFTRFQVPHLSEKLEHPIHFEFDKLSNWGNKVLAARLKPSLESKEVYQILLRNRKRIFENFLCPLGFSKRPELKDYTPHISLGYFANKEGGELTLTEIEEWTKTWKLMTENKTITFHHFSLYGFTDMATFVKTSQL